MCRSRRLQPAETHGEEVDQQQAEPEGREGNARDGDDHAAIILPAAALHTAESTPMSRPKMVAQIMAKTVSQTVGIRRSPISVMTGRRVLMDNAEIALQGIAREAHILLPQRPFESEGLAHSRHVLRRGIHARDQPRGIARQQMDEGEHHHGDREDHRDDARRRLTRYSSMAHPADAKRRGAGARR